MIAQKFKRKHGVALLLFPAVFAGLGTGLVSAQDGRSRLASTTSSNPAVMANHAKNHAGPEVSTEPKEHGLPQEATEIERLFGLPITNSMVVTWDHGAVPDRFC